MSPAAPSPLRRIGLTLLVLGALAAGSAQTAAAAPRADLRVSSLAPAQSLVTPGGRLVVRLTTANAGKARAKASRTDVYLSRDAKKDRSDTRLATRSIKALKAKRSGSATVTVTIPNGTAPGDYRLLACADGAARTRESSESNNCRAARGKLVVGRRTTPSPTATPAPAQTATPAPSATAGASPEPTATATVSPEPTATATPEPPAQKSEVEPNDDRAAADARGIELAGPLPGRIASADDVDVFRVVVGETQAVKLDVTARDGASCAGATDPVLELLDATDVAGADDDSGDGTCATLTRTLGKGTYYARVSTASGKPFDYQVSSSALPGALLTSTTPDSPSDAATPALLGSATTGSTVQVFAGASCTGTPVTAGSAAQLATGALTVAVPESSTSTFSARAALGDATGPCSPAPLTYTRAAAAAEPNDTFAQAAELGIPARVRGVLETGDVDIYRLRSATSVTLRISTRGPDGASCPAGVGMRLRVLAEDGSQLVEADPSLACPEITYHLPADTTRYVRVDNSAGTTFGYVLRTAVSPTVAFAGLPPSGADDAPEIKGTATPGSTVRLFTGIGCTGPVRATGSATEFAGDGITLPLPPNRTRIVTATAELDGVTGGCVFASGSVTNTTGRPQPTLGEIEPNNTRGQAADTLPRPTYGSLVGATISGNDVDVFRFDTSPTTPRVVRIETFDVTGADCRDLDTNLRVETDQGVALATDEDSGNGPCSAIVTTLPTGPGEGRPVYITVTAFNATATPYRLAITPTTNVDEPAADNDFASTATLLAAGDVHVIGDHSQADDVDVYAVTLTETRSLRVQTFSTSLESPDQCGSATPSIPATMDTSLRVLGPDGKTVITTRADNVGKCEVIDGTGSFGSINADTRLRDLAPGTYYVEVASPAGAPAALRTFSYGLNVTVR